MSVKESAVIQPDHPDHRAQWMKRSQANMRTRRIRQNIPWMIMFLPVVLYFLIFKYAPMAGYVIAFKNYNFTDGVFGSPWVGMNNYRLLFSDPSSVSTIRNTLLLSVLTIIVGFPFPVILAIMFNEVRRMWFKKTVQTLMYLPHFLSWVVVGGLVVTIFSQETGIVNHWLEKLTGSTYGFMYNEFSWIALFLGSGIWKGAGFGAIIYLAALSSIDPSLYESAAMDGAGKFRQIWHITLPGIRSTIVLMLILNMGHVMEVGFDQIYVLQNPTVSHVSEVISTYVFRVGLQGMQFGLTTAMGLFESLVGLTLVVLANSVARKFGQNLW
ncbi:MAG: sugar transporter permease [Paenibacillaceae bacterium]|nr:sugar transporter permease [Paenibacillaceae bacterium]